MDAVKCFITYASTIHSSKMFDYICSISSIILALMTVLRAANVGYLKESYIISAFAYIPIIYKMYMAGFEDMFILHVFYLIVSIFAFYRWRLPVQKSHSHN